MVRLNVSPEAGDLWGRWLIRAVLLGFVLVELAAVAWIAYKIINRV